MQPKFLREELQKIQNGNEGERKNIWQNIRNVYEKKISKWREEKRYLDRKKCHGLASPPNEHISLLVTILNTIRN